MKIIFNQNLCPTSKILIYCWYIFLVSIFIQDKEWIPGNSNSNYLLSSLLVFILSLGLLIRGKKLGNLRIPFSTDYKILFFFLLIYFLSLALVPLAPTGLFTIAEYSSLWQMSFMRFFQRVSYFLIIPLISFFVTDEVSLKKTIFAIAVPITLMSLFFALIEFFRYYTSNNFLEYLYRFFHSSEAVGDDGSTVFMPYSKLVDIPRLTLFAREPSLAGLQIIVIWPFLVNVLEDSVQKKKKIIISTLLMTSIIILFATWSTSVILTFFCQLLIWVWLSLKYKINSKSIFIFGFMLIFALVFLTPVLVDSSERLFSLGTGIATGDGSALIRLMDNAIAINIFFQHPLFGVGAGGYAFYYNDNLIPSFLFDHSDIFRIIILMGKKGWVPASIWTMTLVETGLVGFIVFCVLLLKYLKNMISVLTKFDSFLNLKKYSVAILVSFLGIVITSFVSGAQFFWFPVIGFMALFSNFRLINNRSLDKTT